MKRISGIVALTAALGFACGMLPASAQYANEFSPAKLVHQGTTTKDVAGTGLVVVQVQVNPDGSHKVVKIIKSNNAGDNAAAMDIAQNSSYRPAHRGTTPIGAFYDFTLKFNGKIVVNNNTGGGSSTPTAVSSAAVQVADLIRKGQYAQAKSKAQVALISSPGDASLRQMYGIAAFDAGDPVTAAQAFDKVPEIGKQFKQIAAASYAQAAVAADTPPAQALAYAQKAVALDPNPNTRFALGVAQLANKQNAEALATLRSVHDSFATETKLTKAEKANIDARLMAAYLANNDQQDAQALVAEIKVLDPTSTLPGRVMGNTYLKLGVDAGAAKNYDVAFKNLDQAAAMGDPEVAVTANLQAAFLITHMDKPDFKKMQAYADKALALKPDSPEANYAEGVALAAQAAANHDAALKQKAVDSLNKADALAKAAGNTALSLTIETFIKNQVNGAPAGP